MITAVVFRLPKKKVIFTFNDLDHLEKFCYQVQKEYPEQSFYVVSKKVPTMAPEGYYPQKKGVLWCPYCAKERKFQKWRENPKYKVCEICGISDSNYMVRKANHLWQAIVIGEDGELSLRKGTKSKKIRKVKK